MERKLKGWIIALVAFIVVGIFAVVIILMNMQFGYQIEKLENQKNVSEAAIVTTTPEASTTPEPEATPTTTETVYTSGQVDQINENTVSVFIVNPEAPDKEQIPHPGIYYQTNVSGNPIIFQMEIPEGYIGIIGGFTVNNETNGSYRAVGPGEYQFEVTDGFVEIIRQEWAQNEWNFRLGQCQEYDWACDHISTGPLTNN